MNRIKQIISGGQTGVDQAGLRVGSVLNIKTGGWMPKGFRTDEGNKPEFEKMYGMFQTKKSGYPLRTKRNVIWADGTLIMGHMNSPGCRLTASICHEEDRHLLKINQKEKLFDAVRKIRLWLTEKDIMILNVAGNRESSYPGIGAWAEMVLFETLKRDDEIVN